jgi:primosomal protein N'
MKYYYKCPKCGTTEDYHCPNCGNEDVFESLFGGNLECEFCAGSDSMMKKCNNCGILVNSKFFKEKKEEKEESDMWIFPTAMFVLVLIYFFGR